MKYDFSPIKKHSLERIAEKKLVGCGSMICIGGEKVWEDYTGMASVENNEPIRPDSIYRLASMSKPVTGVAVMQLVEQGKLGLFDDVKKFFPELTGFGVAGRDENGKIVKIADARREMTVFDMLTHTSGLAQNELGFAQLGEKVFAPYMRPGITLSEMIPLFNKILLDCQPGEATGYGAQAPFDTLGGIVEKVADMPFGEYLDKNIFGPLGMTDTTFHLTPEQRTRRVSIYEADGENVKLMFPDCPDNMIGVPESLEAGSCNLAGTVSDYMKFAEMLLGKGEYRGVRILKRATVEFMSTPLVRPETVGYNIGQVWGISMRVINTPDPNAMPPFGTFGWSGAYGTHFIVCPFQNLAAVYCSNLTNAGGSGAATAFEFECDVVNAVRKQ